MAWLKVYKEQGLGNNACNSFYQNLATMYTQHKYTTNYIWNYDET